MPDHQSVQRLAPWHDRLSYGGDYNPEQWSRETWREDMRLMRQAGVTTATIGVFSWSCLEPAPGQFEFGWLDEVMDLLHANGINAILATPTASPPPWFSTEHPQALPVTDQGVRLIHGSRDTYNPAAPAYREASRRIVQALADRYSAHPALAMWHIHNEYGTVSYGPVTDAAFRQWLAVKYGDVQTLNRTWNTAFWSQRYTTFEQIYAPQATQYLPNPALVLDFKRFTADMLSECLAEQAQILRAANPQIPLTTNFMLPTWNHYDQWQMAAQIDQVSIDHYPDEPGAASAAQVALAGDQARSFNDGQPWLLMEQATTLTYDYAAKVFHAKEPEQMRTHTLQYLARGATGSLFFQWRAPLVGAEFFHSAMVPHTGEDSRTYREITALGLELATLKELAQPPADGRVNRPKVAVLWSADAWWATQTRAMPSGQIDFLPSVRGAHRALWDLGINADVVNPDGDLSAYDLIVIPSAMTMSDAQQAALETFVSGGGHLAAWFLTGTLDEHMRIRTGSFSAAIAELAGIRVEEHVPLAPDAQIRLSDGSAASVWSEVVHLRGAQAVTTYEADAGAVVGAGAPAITQHSHGEGTVHYISTRLDDDALRRHLQRICDVAGIGPEHPGAGDGVEIVRRYAGTRSYLFAFNHGTEARPLELSGHDLLSDTRIDGQYALHPGDALVLAEDPAAQRPASGPSHRKDRR